MPAVAAEKRSYVRMPRDQRMREIEAAARSAFAKHGFNDAPISEIARRAGVSEGAIYKFYANKRELLHAILTGWYGGITEAFHAKQRGVEGTRARLHAVIWQHLKSIQESPDLCRLFYSEVRSAPDYQSSELHRCNRDYTRVLTDILEAGIERGDIRADVSLPLVRDMVFGGIEHRVTGFLAGRGALDPDAVADEMTRMLFAGIAPPVEEATDLGAIVSRLESVAERLDTAGLGAQE